MSTESDQPKGRKASRRIIAPHFDEDEFWAKVDVGDEDDCWHFEGYQRPEGYGLCKMPDGSAVHAHRVAWALAEEEPREWWVLHHCDNPPCVNPNHLYLGDQSDNTKDMFERGQKRADNHHNPNATLSRKDVREIKERLAAGETQQEIADDYPVIRQTIGHINTGERWSI